MDAPEGAETRLDEETVAAATLAEAVAVLREPARATTTVVSDRVVAALRQDLAAARQVSVRSFRTDHRLSVPSHTRVSSFESPPSTSKPLSSQSIWRIQVLT